MQQVASPTAPPVRRGRGRPTEQRKQPTAGACVREVCKSDRAKEAQSSPSTQLTTIRPEMIEDKSDSAITKHTNYHQIACKVHVLMSLVAFVL